MATSSPWRRPTLTSREGEFLTLLGPSGSGKTTLLSLIAGLAHADEGQVLIDGTDVTYSAPYERDIGLVFQNYALFPHMTVEENIAFPLQMRKLGTAEARRKVAEVLEIVRLPHVAKRFPRELSGGQQQRIALARCMVYRPAIILMDEPLGALDKKLREQMQLEIKRIHRELGATVVYVTHDQEEAMTMSDRICLMNAGRIEQLGTPGDLYFRPRSLFVADFLGESNLLPAEVMNVAGDAITVRLGDESGGASNWQRFGLLHEPARPHHGAPAKSHRRQRRRRRRRQADRARDRRDGERQPEQALSRAPDAMHAAARGRLPDPAWRAQLSARRYPVARWDTADAVVIAEDTGAS